jgi:hypothetical protein
MTRPELEEAMAKMDRDGSGGVDVEEFVAVRARPGRLSALSLFHCKSLLYGSFVWVRRVLTSPKHVFLAGQWFPSHAAKHHRKERVPLKAGDPGGMPQIEFKVRPGRTEHPSHTPGLRRPLRLCSCLPSHGGLRGGMRQAIPPGLFDPGRARRLRARADDGGLRDLVRAHELQGVLRASQLDLIAIVSAKGGAHPALAARQPFDAAEMLFATGMTEAEGRALLAELARRMGIDAVGAFLNDCNSNEVQ